MNGLVEHPMYLESKSGSVFAVETEPNEAGRGGVVIGAGGWLGTGTNRNAVLVRLARELAEHGYRAMRFGWHGTGESGGRIERFDLRTPFSPDVDAMLDHLTAAGETELAVTGICFGSVSALAAARNNPAVTRVALISLPFPSKTTKSDHKTDRIDARSAMQMAARPATWSALLRNEGMRRAAWKGVKRKLFGTQTKGKGVGVKRKTEGLDTAQIVEELVDRGVRVSLIFGEGDLEYSSYRSYIETTPFPPQVEVAVVPGDLSNFGTLTAQQAAIDHVVAALTR
jgi:alpha/beta superfamily hydrolase